MRFVTEDHLIRPLLSTSREDVRAWASQERFRWREDSSNADLRFTRNRLRLQTIPKLSRDYNGNLEAVLAGTARLAQAEEDFWSQELDRVYQDLEKRTRLGSIFRVGDIQNLHLALRRRLIRRVLSDTRPERLQGIEFEHIEAILALCGSSEGHDRVLVPGVDALRSFDSLLFAQPGQIAAEPRGYSVSISAGEWYGLPFGTGQICVRQVKPERLICDKFKEDQEFGIERALLNRSILNGSPLAVRNWEPGDALRRAGHQSVEKIKKLFQEHRVLLWERRHWPVLQCGEEIAWARSFGVAQKFSVTRGEAEQVELLYRPAECVQAQLL
jgi:tRNA(Ile)-lysidine synthase